jgi:hypothetical protein
MDLFRVCDGIIVSLVIYMVMEVIYVMDCDIYGAGCGLYVIDVIYM